MRRFQLGGLGTVWLLSLLFGATDALAAGPSFQCDTATSPNELAICASDTLSLMDSIANRDFQFVRHSIGKRKANQLNRPLISAREACGSDERCIFNTQYSAIKAFEKYGAPDGVPSGLAEKFKTQREIESDRKSEAQAALSQSAQESSTPAKPNAIIQLDLDTAMKLNQRIGELNGQITILKKVILEQQDAARNVPGDDRNAVQTTVDALNARVNLLESEYTAKETAFSRYLTSVKPDDKDSYLTARKASMIYPKVPYYIPGTNETGEFWVEPKVTDTGDLVFNFRVIDPEAQNDTTRSNIVMNPSQLTEVQQGLFRLYMLSQKAHENQIHESYAKRIVCFPVEQCPEEHAKGSTGKSSTELLFQVYEDGSTAGRFLENKGSFQSGFNVSVESALMLQAYLSHILKQSAKEFQAGTRTQKDLDKLFQ